MADRTVHEIRHHYSYIPRRLSKAHEHIRGILKAELMKWLFHVSINYFKLWLIN